MFQQWKDKDKILVTGPMRSGTTICAEMIAADTGKIVYREECLLDVPWREMPLGVVLQAPVLLPVAGDLHREGWFVVVMDRSWEEILSSTKRFMADAWTKGMIDDLLAKQQMARELANSDLAVRVRYEELRHHPLWVSDRKGWGRRQTQWA